MELKVKLMQKLKVKKSEARIVALMAAATATALATPLTLPTRAEIQRTIADKNDISNEVLLKVISIIFYFGSIS